MDALIMTLGGSALLGLFFLFWLNTKSGKKWLQEL